MSTVFNKAGETPWYVQLFFPLLLGLGQFPAQQILAIGPLTVLYPLSKLFAPWLSASFDRCEMLVSYQRLAIIIFRELFSYARHNQEHRSECVISENILIHIVYKIGIGFVVV